MRYRTDNHTDEQITTIWEKLLSNIDKYYHTPIVGRDDDGTVRREFIISPRKAWAFNMLNNVWCNYDLDDYAYIDDYKPGFNFNHTGKGVARTPHCIYSIITSRYSYGNIRVVVSVKIME